MSAFHSKHGVVTLQPRAMKSLKTSDLERGRRRHPAGFALVITLSLMVLLTVLAVGLLSLSTISLRSSSQENFQLEARSNARMALALAIGELQKTLGADKAVTANSELLSSDPSKPGLMGVWESWDYTSEISGGSASPDYDGEKQSRFKSWLVSAPDYANTTSIGFGDSDWDGQTITLADVASYGGLLPSAGPMLAGRVPLTLDDREVGAYAWRVSDESLKARINLFRDPSKDETLAEKRALLAGHRPDVSRVADGLDFLDNDDDPTSYELAETASGKITGLHQAELSGQGGLGKLKPLRDQITPYSLGVLADVRNGGLKKDLSSIFEMSDSSASIKLPGEFNNASLYESTHRITGESDPRWSRLSSCYNVFKDLAGSDTDPIFDQGPAENISIPRRGRNPIQPKLFSPGPVIAKVQVLFSIVTRPPHNGPDNRKDGQLHLIYTPMVTLHNPYNVQISFDMLEVSFQSLPVGFNFLIDGMSINGGRLNPFNELYDRGRTLGAIEKSIVLKVSNWSGYDSTVTEISGGKSESQINREADQESSDAKTPIVMKPGQTLLCSPYLDPASEFGRYGHPNTFFDFGNQLTRSIKTKPGFFGNTVGFDLDWLKNSVVHLERRPKNTSIGVICGAARPTQGGNAAFEVEAEITVNGRKRSYGGIQMSYPDLRDLEKALKETEFNTTAVDSFVPNEGGGDAQISQHSNAKPFALFTAAARTTSGGVNEAGVRADRSQRGNVLVNGIYAGKPFLFNNAALPMVSTDLAQEKLGAQSYELSLEPVTKSTMSKLLQSDSANRTRFLTGNTSEFGIKSGSYLEVASGPLQAIADFRRTNVLASGFAPSFTQPISNSTASPIIDTRSVTQDGASYKLLDHSLLANHALYDGFYFSTFASDGDFSPEEAFSNFMDGSEPLLSQAFTPHLGNSATVDEVAGDLFSGGTPNDTAYLKAAQYQLVQGAFNVNSTSIPAWKARLAAMRGSKVPVLKLDGGNVETVSTKDTPILSMTLPNAEAVDVSGDLFSDEGKENRWNGFRELTDAQLEGLAARIVDQVRERGPFLSMSEFVNRRVGPTSEKTEFGALELAIQKAGLNEEIYPNQIPVSMSDISGTEYGFATPEVVVGNPAAGAPGWISQGDLMKVLEPAATVRADTFVIRVCGEARDGDEVTRAYAEAVVQRFPEYIDPAMEPSENAYDGSNQANKTFGRRLEIVSFRWLSKAEI